MIVAHSRNTVNPALFPQKAQALRLWDGGTRMALLNPAPGVFVWDKLDAHLAASEAAGLPSIYVFGSTPAWASIPTSGQPGIIDPTSNRPVDLTALANFVDALMAHCGSRLWVVETWNEWNAPAFWIGTNDQLACQQHVIYEHVKDNNPDVLVTTPTPCWAPKCKYVTVDAAHAALIPYCLEYDVVTYHGYNDRTLPPGPQDKATIQNLRKVFPDSRLWDTEFGPGSPTSFATPDAARLWALRSFMAREQGGLELACWYQWDNQTHGPCQDTTGAITVLGQAILDYCSIT